ncbi:hypothetical protein [Dyadobacter sp. NIV53]|uniref:hypothetical protein n=1 Tax=Dyadobacter sp. NIV53 TaxID=2861765 RepID=UPI001C8877A1|nr:hypothetical protein [Dyadobacter sp. NIV53]
MSARNYPIGYQIPKYNVLLISCMDLRLLDNIVHFMEHENLTNRYDQYVMAGASIGALFETAEPEDDLKNNSKYYGWKNGLLNHIDIAIDLHDIRDIYIMEHQNCGAYRAFFKDDLGDYDIQGAEKELIDHSKYSLRLSDLLQAYFPVRKAELHSAKDSLAEKFGKEINIHCFMMDLRGDVKLLHTTADVDVI